MKLIPVTSNQQAVSLRNLNTLAIDLGFAQEANSCGLSNQEDGVTFSEAIQKTLSWARVLAGNSGVLIVEAPLSASFTADGNPCPRGDFETRHSVTGDKDRRVWQSGPGASMAIAAFHFLRSLLHTEDEAKPEIHLVEGFCSRYGGTKADKPSDVAVARRLVSQWQNDTELTEPDGHSKLSTLHIVAPDTPNTPPAILRLPDGLTAATVH